MAVTCMLQVTHQGAAAVANVASICFSLLSSGQYARFLLCLDAECDDEYANTWSQHGPSGPGWYVADRSPLPHEHGSSRGP